MQIPIVQSEVVKILHDQAFWEYLNQIAELDMLYQPVRFFLNSGEPEKFTIQVHRDVAKKIMTATDSLLMRGHPVILEITRVKPTHNEALSILDIRFTCMMSIRFYKKISGEFEIGVAD